MQYQLIKTKPVFKIKSMYQLLEGNKVLGEAWTIGGLANKFTGECDYFSVENTEGPDDIVRKFITLQSEERNYLTNYHSKRSSRQSDLEQTWWTIKDITMMMYSYLRRKIKTT